MPRPDVDEVDLDPVDLGRELRQRVQPRLDPTEVVLVRPVARERLDRRQLHALRAVLDELLGGQARRRDAPAQVVDLFLRDLDLNDRISVGVATAVLMRSSPCVLTRSERVAVGSSARRSPARSRRPSNLTGGVQSIRRTYRAIPSYRSSRAHRPAAPSTSTATRYQGLIDGAARPRTLRCRRPARTPKRHDGDLGRTLHRQPRARTRRGGPRGERAES